MTSHYKIYSPVNQGWYFRYFWFSCAGHPGSGVDCCATEEDCKWGESVLKSRGGSAGSWLGGLGVWPGMWLGELGVWGGVITLWFLWIVRMWQVRPAWLWKHLEQPCCRKGQANFKRQLGGIRGWVDCATNTLANWEERKWFSKLHHFGKWWLCTVVDNWVLPSVWKSGPGTSKRLRPDQDWTTKDWKIERPEKTRTAKDR